MKKILSVLLAVVMVFGIVPVAALAATADAVEITAETYANSSSVTLGGGRDYKIVAGSRVLIKETDTWTVSAGSTLYVAGYLDIKGTLNVYGYVIYVDNGEVTAKCWSDDNGATYKHCKIVNPKNICNETGAGQHYFAEVHIPSPSKYPGFTDASHKLTVKYLCSVSGSGNDYLKSDLYLDSVDPDGTGAAPELYFADVYTSPDYNSSTGILKVRLNQYLFLHFDFLVNGRPSKKYDGDRMSIYYNRLRVKSNQGVCSYLIDVPGDVEFKPAVLADIPNSSFNVWKDSYFLRQERIYIPSGSGYSAFGVNGEVSADDQTVRLNYGDEFKFRVTIDDQYSDSAYNVYLVKGYKWDERNHADSMEALLDEVYIDENGTPQNFVWKFEEYKDGEQQKIYIDQYGVYHISAVDDEYTIVVTGVVSNDTLSLTANIMDTIRNLLNAIKQFFERVKKMLGL